MGYQLIISVLQVVICCIRIKPGGWIGTQQDAFDFDVQGFVVKRHAFSQPFHSMFCRGINREGRSRKGGMRAMLAEQFLKSLDVAKQAEIDAAWSEEADRRIQAVDLGQVVPVPGKQVLQALRSR